MTPELYRKLTSYRKREIKKLRKYAGSADDLETNAMDVEPLVAYVEAGEKPRQSIQGLLEYVNARRWGDVVLALDDEDQASAQLSHARYITHGYLARKLQFDMMQAGLAPKAVITHASLARLALQLFSIGWDAEAKEVVTGFWAQLPKCTVPDPGKDIGFINPHETLAWFASYFTLGNQDLINQWNVAEPEDPDTPYSHLLGRWNEADASALTNLMTAYSEQTVARMLLPESKRTPDFDPYLMAYCAYDLTAIQMRRKLAGLDPIPMDDPRMSDHFFDYEEAPLVQDDLVWPCYLKACTDNGITPYVPRNTVQAVTDRATLLVKPL